MSIYIQSASQISIQEPLSNLWFENPIFYKERYVRAIEPDYKPFISPMAARRMGKILKRAIATALTTIAENNADTIDAIIVGTGLGCVESTEIFLQSMIKQEEEFLQPTYFMQSTHNMISSQIALQLKCHGYNSTYSQHGISFESALMDIYQQFLLQKINTGLVCGHDEMTPDYFKLFDQIGYWKKGEISENILRKNDSKGSFSGESSVSFLLKNTMNDKTLCKIDGVDLLYTPCMERLEQAIHDLLKKNNISFGDLDAVFVGMNGDCENDEVYLRKKRLFLKTPFCWYKHLFGESLTAAGIGMYVAANCLHKNFIPKQLFYEQHNELHNIKNILVYNHFQDRNHSLILLSQC